MNVRNLGRLQQHVAPVDESITVRIFISGCSARFIRRWGKTSMARDVMCVCVCVKVSATMITK